MNMTSTPMKSAALNEQWLSEKNIKEEEGTVTIYAEGMMDLTYEGRCD